MIREEREEREEAISYIKLYRRLDENLHNTAPKDSISYYTTGKCLKYWDMALKALSQEPCDDAVSREYLKKIAQSEGAYGYVSAHDIATAPSVMQKSDNTAKMERGAQDD